MTKLNWKEHHHFYFGLIAAGLSWFGIFELPRSWWIDIPSAILGIFAAWMIGDDLWQHWWQKRNPEKDYESPVHLLWVTIRRLMKR